MTREEAQGWLDHVAEVFGRDEAAVSTSALNGSHPKSAKKPKKSSSSKAATAEMIAG